MEFLVIDDDKVFRDAACLLIEEEGHQAQPAGNGAAALAALRGKVFDAALLDVRLGTQNGLDVLPQILQGQANLPVIMLTAEGRVGDGGGGDEARCAGFPGKTFPTGTFSTRAGAGASLQQDVAQHLSAWNGKFQNPNRNIPTCSLIFNHFRCGKSWKFWRRAARSEGFGSASSAKAAQERECFGTRGA